MMRSLTILVGALLLAVGCGGSGGGGSDSGIGSSGTTRGAITGTGSAVVAGTRFVTSGADVTIDRVVQPDDSTLAPGMTARVAGTRSGDGSTGVADRVDVDDAIQGPVGPGAPMVDSQDPREADLTILDQTVRIVDGRTVFAGTSFGGIVAGDDLEVFGFRDEDGVIFATRVEDLGATSRVELKGTVTSLMTAGSPDTFEIGAITIEFDAAATDLPDGVPAEGDFVEVEGVQTGATTVDATTAADRIEIEDPDADDVPDYQIEGIVSDFVNRSDFRVDGQPVDAGTLGIAFEPTVPLGQNGFLEDGARVEIEGRLAGGVVQAAVVRLRGGEVLIAAEIANAMDIDAGNDMVTLLDAIDVETDAATRFDGNCAVFGDLMAAQFLEVRGVAMVGDVLATDVRCETDAGDPDAEIRGRVQSSNGVQREFVILGLAIPTDGGTVFAGFPPTGGGSPLDTEDEFYAYLLANPDTLLEVKDLADGDPTLLDAADEVRLGADD